MNKKQKKNLYRIIIAAVLLVVAAVIPAEGVTRLILFLIPYLIVGYDILRKAALGIVNGQVFDENFLMAVASLGAIILGEYPEGTFVILFYQVGELFQSYAVDRSRKNISELMDICPDYANLETEPGVTETVDPDDVEVGSIIVVKPGEKIPIDGVIIEGSTVINTSALTGESVPRDADAGDEVISGCINMTGLIRIRTSKEFGDSTVSKILELVENSSMKKARSENFITKFAKYYTPAVCLAALVLAIVPPIFYMSSGGDPNWSSWIFRALTFLVISCPCALVISIPLSFFGGIGGASSSGILVKGSNYLELLAKAKYIVMDKTGTLTKGSFEVTGIYPGDGMTEEKLVEYAAYCEIYSNHPISTCIKNAYGVELDGKLVSDETEIGGHGVEITYNGQRLAAGNIKLMKKLGIEAPEVPGDGTFVYVAADGKYAGCILIADTIKENSKAAVSGLKQMGMKKIVMLTGDGKRAAESVASQLGVDEVRSELLPEDKVNEVERLLEEKQEGEQLIFVGDGINDAPVLMRADIGIAMGAMGSDAAIEAADIVLMDDDPAKIAKAVRISKKTLRIVYENIVLALSVKGICLALGAAGLVGMWAAIFADVGIMVIAVLNSMRSLRTKNI